MAPAFSFGPPARSMNRSIMEYSTTAHGTPPDGRSRPIGGCSREASCQGDAIFDWRRAMLIREVMDRQVHKHVKAGMGSSFFSNNPAVVKIPLLMYAILMFCFGV